MYIYSYEVKYINDLGEVDYKQGYIKSTSPKIKAIPIMEYLNINRDNILYLCISRIT